ncbi:hypothetical protein [Pseudomonas caricapapayae]|uniref:Uncharacterized protein n=1 Tax=Pseudomonas caricapapayae TaxID=46678 RepID=A0A3M3B8Y4_9PSED|nr:hypothetical protein [Pseudomonas caricapapayae]KAA8685754.1 hypothetical protein F4W67_29585 [Pseudomonas caricapapayae]RMM09154.1 hypothetical protein ALQ84_200332 [Pseudomonas caricapapayae]
MKLALVQLVAVLTAIVLGEAGQRTADLAFSKAGFLALALSLMLMLASLTVEIFEALCEESPVK